MSILIKGMDAPPNCWWCPVKFWNDTEYICPFSHKHINSGDADRHDDCPLIELPDHGRLIDADADAMFPYLYDHLDDEHIVIAQLAIDDAPTVIEAERSEE